MYKNGVGNVSITLVIVLICGVYLNAGAQAVQFEMGGWIQDWLLCGPFYLKKTNRPVPDSLHLPGFEIDYLAKIGGEMSAGIKPGQKINYSKGEVSFAAYHTSTDVIDLDDAVSTADNVLAYAFTEIEVSEDQTAVLAIGSNDGGRAWLNGEPVWDFTGARGVRKDEDKMPVFLKKGRNSLLLKIEERGNNWGFCARFLPFEGKTFLHDIPVFSVIHGDDGRALLRFLLPESAIDLLFRHVDMQISPKDDRKEILWQSGWTKRKETILTPQNPIYTEYTLHLDAVLTDGEKWVSDIPFFMGIQQENITFKNKLAECRVDEFGAAGDGRNKDTRAIQAAIDSCTKNGGGTVFFPPGIYLSGSLHLKSNVALYLDHGATLLASPDDTDFDPYETLDFENDSDHETSYFHFALLWGEDVKRITISGTGTIDGNRNKRGGPKPIALKRCQQVLIENITILNAPNYAISMLGTDYVNIDGVSILNGYCDGIDPDACRHVRISNCHIDSYDDAIVPKTSYSLGYHRSTEYLTVTNCQLATNCNAFKLGTESGGDFKYITVSNCVMFDRITGRPPTSGISLESVDGANIDGITIDNISMNNVRVPVFIRLGNRGRDMDEPIPGTLQNVIISNITATGADQACLISGIPGHFIKNVLLDNLSITYRGGGTTDHTDVEVPELIDQYPSATMFKQLSCFGFYLRHISNIKLEDIRFNLEAEDERHALVADDCNQLEIESLRTPRIKAGAPVISLQDVQEAVIRNCALPQGTGKFLSVNGAASRDICLLQNDFKYVQQVFVKDADVKEDVVKQMNNY